MIYFKLGKPPGGDRPALLSEPPRTGPGYGPPGNFFILNLFFFYCEAILFLELLK